MGALYGPVRLSQGPFSDTSARSVTTVLRDADFPCNARACGGHVFVSDTSAKVWRIRAESQSLEAGGRPEPALVRPRFEDVRDLIQREAELVVGCEVVRAKADASAGTEVAEYLPLRQLLVHRLEVRHVHDHGAAAPLGLARRPDLESARFRELDQQLRLAHRVASDALHADLFY